MTERYKTKQYATWLVIGALLLLLLGYTGYEIQRIVFGPKITITSPQNGALVTDSLLQISGRAENINDISLNDRKIFLDEKGNFSEEVLLSYGYNVLTFDAADRFGRKTEKVLEVIYK
jgi:hypothetical protein